MEKIIEMKLSAITGNLYVKEKDVNRPVNTFVWGMTAEGIPYKVSVISKASMKGYSGSIVLRAIINTKFPDMPLKFIDPGTTIEVK